MTSRKSGLSSKVRLTVGTGFGGAARSRTMKINKTAAQRAQQEKEYNDQIAGTHRFHCYFKSSLLFRPYFG